MNSEPKNNKKRAVIIHPDRSGVYRYGFIVGVFILLIDLIRSAYRKSGLHEVLTGGDFGDNMTLPGIPEGRLADRAAKASLALRRFRMRVIRFISVSLENSTLVRVSDKLSELLLNTSARAYGTAFASYGIVSAALLFLRSTLGLEELADRGELTAAGIILAACVLLLFCSEKKLIVLISSSVISGSIVCAGLDFLPDRLRPTDSDGLSGTAAAILGTVLALPTFFVSPTLPLQVLALVLLLRLIFSQPEIGVVLSAAVLPFTAFTDTPSAYLCLITVITAFAYCVKLVTVRRIARFRKIDFAVLAVLVTVLSGTVWRIPGSPYAAARDAIMIGIYFLFVTAMRDRVWLRMCRAAMVIPAACAAFVNVINFATDFLPPSSAVGSAISEAFEHIAFSFASEDAFALYLTMILPFALAAALSSASRVFRILSGTGAALMLADVIILRSRSTWLGLLVGCAFFLLLIAPRLLAAFPPILLVFALACIGFSDILGPYVSGFFSLPGDSISFRSTVWSGVTAMIRERPVFGYGIGESVFREVYKDFALFGAEGATHSFSLYLHMAFSLGLSGVFVLLFSLLCGAVSAFSFIVREDKKSETYRNIAAGLGSLIACLSAGIVNYTWFDGRLFFLFWLIAGFIAASVRIGRNESKNAAYESGAATGQSADTVL